MEELISTTGAIGDLTIPQLFQGLLADKKTGIIAFLHEPVVKKVSVVRGEVIFASSSLSEDRLVEWLFRSGKLTMQQRDTTVEMVKKTGNKAGMVLQELGYITAGGLADGIRYQVRQIVLSLFNWRTGSYLFDEDPALDRDGDQFTMNTRELIIDGLRDMEWSVVRKSLPPLGTILQPVADRSLPVQGEELEHDHRTVLSFVDGSASIEDICARSGLGDFNALKAVYALLALRLAVKGGLKKEGGAKPVRDAASNVVDAKEKKTSGPGTPEPLTVAVLLEAHQRLAQQDHYEVLGVGRSATAQEIKKAYFVMAKRYHPDRHFGPPLNEMKGQLEALFNAIHEAQETLASPDRRERYNRELAAGAKQPRVKKKDGADKNANAAAAIAQFKDGMKYFSERNYWDAEEAFQWAERFDSSNAEYVFRRAMALAHMPRRGRDAEEYFMKAIAMNPSASGFYLEFANFYLKVGLKSKAASICRDALKRSPGSDQIRDVLRKAGG